MRYNTGLTNAELHILREFVSRNMGLHFPSEQFLELERGFSNIVRECGENNPSGFLRKAVTSGLSVDELQIFAQHLTTGETYFYREPERLQTFETVVLPEIIKQKRQTNRTIRLWSAGCSSGEEP